jgi:lipopolysaccharide/colanic/teichoic acid biosynthesis glycosyltransferase/DNA-directed RNA polymerase specialized sigma24 family protein
VTREPDTTGSVGSAQLHASLDALSGAGFEARAHMRAGNAALGRYLDQWQAYLESSSGRRSAAALSLKRILDLLITIPLTIFLAPALLAVALAVKIDSRGPALLRRPRVGAGGRVYRARRFRTRALGVEGAASKLRGPAGEHAEDLLGSVEIGALTSVGRFLGRHSLDRMPELLDVISGHLSLVGRRPHAPGEGHHRRRPEEIPPGLTGIWEISVGRDATLARFEEADRWYLEHWSPLLDLRILVLRIAPAALRRRSPLARRHAAPTSYSGHGSGAARPARRGDELDRRQAAAVAEGDLDALGFLYVRYRESIERYLLGMVGDSDLASDLTSNLFAALPRDLQRYEREQGRGSTLSLDVWLLITARNRALDHLRAERHLTSLRWVAGPPPPDRDLRAALEELPVDYREVLVLRHVVGLTPDEIAKALGRSEDEVSGIELRARSVLEDRAGGYEHALEDLTE